MTARNPNAIRAPNRIIRLSSEVTWDLCPNPSSSDGCRFLHKNGTYLCEGPTEETSGPITVFSWEEARRVANEINADFIMYLREKRVYFRYVFPSGHHTWFRAIVIPHKSIEAIDGAEVIAKEEIPAPIPALRGSYIPRYAPGTEPPSPKRLSGAAQRKLKRKKEELQARLKATSKLSRPVTKKRSRK